ncbi:MAG: ABC transporter ATP-binding protein [Methanoregula sp.]|nr:ABC transporter ATP-binding protein [Methanoregula sp.]
MSDVVIRVENLCKEYRLGTISHGTLYRDIQSGWAKLRGTEDPNARIGAVNREQLNNTNDRFCALKDVSFDVRQGEIVGIIGRNGAGKSTLLKIISRVTAPTSGTIKIKGRVASLLEVGTGFHPELTGRENIFLNGAILGMHKGEIEQKFDEIVAFSEIDKFIDTPVKRYSSGMYVRLAFAVAAHLDPEILVVDEVLAVGDAQFQKKCMGKMGDVAKEGRTVVFVSHQMGSIAQLCKSAILLKEGRIIRKGLASDIIIQYINDMVGNSQGFKVALSGNKDIAIMKAEAINEDGNPVSLFTHTQPITIAITCRINKWIRGAEIRIFVRDSRRNVFTTDTEIVIDTNCKPEMVVAKAVIPGNFLRPEIYFLTLVTYIPNQLTIDLIQDALSIKIIDGGSKYAASEGVDYGCVFVDCAWTIEPASTNK